MTNHSLPVVSLDEAGPSNKQTRAPERRTNEWIVFLVHLARVAMVGLMLIGLHRLAKAYHQVDRDGEKIWPSVDISKHLPQARSLQAVPDRPSLRQALDGDGRTIATLALTSPAADHIIGYSGPTTLLLAMDGTGVVNDVQVLRSFDTPEHLQQVVASDQFWSQFKGWKWGQENVAKVDGVSGATLTSLAIAESILTTMASGSNPDADQTIKPRRSLKFPSELTLKEAQEWQTPDALSEEAVPSPSQGQATQSEMPDELGRVALVSSDVANPDGETRWVIRTGPLSDDISGYQGPTEMLLCLDRNNQLLDARIRSSFDNEPYVRYTKQERSFWKKFKGRTLQDLSTLDLEAEAIDGVSGATMTSVAVAQTIREASQQWIQRWETAQAERSKPTPRKENNPLRTRSWNFSFGEWCTIVLAMAVIPWSVSKWRGDRRLRMTWQVLSFIGIAMISGNLLSIALFSGWTRGGLSYHLAPGLVILLLISFGMAIFKKRNVYCDHLCPHGILQQWIRPQGNSSVRDWRKPWLKLVNAKPVTRLLNASALVSIVLGCLVLITPWTVNLAWLEPFDAYLLGLGFSLSSLVAITSLWAASISPMYYCRNGCPTGKILAYARRDSKANRIRMADGLLFAACCAVWLN